MKQFRRTEEGYYICEECGRIFKNMNGFVQHINCFHNRKKYYDKFLKEPSDGLCKNCSKKTKFISVSQGYKNCCCEDCKNIYTYNRIKEETFKKHGVENIYQSKLIKDRIKNLHGDECSWKCDDVIKKIKSKNKETQEKKRITCQKKYGVDYISQTHEFDKKRRKTCLQKFGVENPSQCPEILEKSLKTRLKIKPYKDTGLWYQSSYELDFLEKYYERFKNDLYRGPTIKYFFNNTNRIYYTDFVIKTSNLVIECKNNYLMKRDEEEIKAKKNATLAVGYNYIIIVDKNYAEFNKIIQNINVSPSTI